MQKPNVCLILVEDSNCNGDCTMMYNYFEATKLLDELGYFSQDIDKKFDINIKPIKQVKHLLFNELPFPRFKFCRMSELYVFSPDGGIYNYPQTCDNNRMKVGEYWPDKIISKEIIYQRHGFSALEILMCKECPLAPICGGGCYAKRAYSFPQKICYKDELMDTLKYIFEKMVGGADNA